MGWTGVLLLLVWLGMAAGVTVWALRARREQRIDLRTRPDGLIIVDRIDVTDLAGDDLGDPTGRA